MNHTHKFHSSADPELFLFITREANWSAAKVYFKGSLIYETKNIHPLLEGLTLTIDGLGVVEMKLQNAAGLLEVDVDGKPFLEDKESKKKMDVSGLVQLFYIVSAWSLVSTFLWSLIFSDVLTETPIAILFVVDLSIGLIYGLTAVLISKRVYWFYFVGAGIFTLLTLVDLLDISSLLLSIFGIIRLLVRLMFLVFILLKMKDILAAMRQSKETTNLELDQ